MVTWILMHYMFLTSSYSQYRCNRLLLAQYRCNRLLLAQYRCNRLLLAQIHTADQK